MAEQPPIIPAVNTPSASAQDPIRVMIEILQMSDGISDTDKGRLITMARDRFKHRRRMAYMCLASIIGSLVVLLIAAFVDGFLTSDPNSIGVTAKIKEMSTAIIWIEGFLASIVTFYYGMSGFRPSS